MLKAYEQPLHDRPLATQVGCYSPTTLREFITNLSNPHAPDKHFIVAFPHDGGKPSFEPLDLDGIQGQVVELQATSDRVCWTSSSFNGWVKKTQVNYLPGFFLEFDIRDKSKRYSDERKSKIVREITQALKSANLPAPNYIVATGSGGLHLYFKAPRFIRNKDDRALSIEQHRHIVDYFIDKIEGTESQQKSWWAEEEWKGLEHIQPDWKIDRTPSRNCIQPLRLPETYHFGADSSVRVYTRNVEEMTWDGLLKLTKAPSKLLRTVTAEQVPKPAQKVQKRKGCELIEQPSLPSIRQVKKGGKHTWGQWYARAHWHCIKLINSGFAKPGCRDQLAFLATNALFFIRFGDDPDSIIDDALSRCYKLISEAGWTEEEFRKNMQTLKTERFHTKLQIRARGYPMGMQEMNARLRDAGLPEIKSLQAPKLSKDEVKERQKASAAATNEKRLDATREKIIDALVADAQATKKGVARATGLSIQTVRKHWDDCLNEAEKRVRPQKVRGGNYGVALDTSAPPRATLEHLKGYIPDIDSKVRGKYYVEDTLDMFLDNQVSNSS